MSKIYDDWERLVEAVLLRQHLRELARLDSLPSFASSSSSSWDLEDGSRRDSLSSFGSSSRDRDLVAVPEPELGFKSSSDLDSEEFIKQFRIPRYILIPDSEIERPLDVPACPILVFINSTSGGQLGGDLLPTYRNILNENQVFDLGEEAPDNALRRIFLNLETLKNIGDGFASELQKKLRLIVGGGDGTASWLLSMVSDLKLSQQPPIAFAPLGTENNISFALGWGKKSPRTGIHSVLAFLDQVQKAKEMRMDSWHILMRMRIAEPGSCDPISQHVLPHSLHEFHRVSEAEYLNTERYCTFIGGFFNYFSMGMDAQVSYALHWKRKLHPEKNKNQLINQRTYESLRQGWFLASLSRPSSWNIAQLCKVKIMKKDGLWQDLHISFRIRSITCLNLPSFAGGLNPWGTPSRSKMHDRDLTSQYMDDGRLEIVGFKDAWDGLGLLTSNGHGKRLAQACRIRFEFHKGAADHMYMMIDGEPWKQPLPVDDATVVMEISHHGRVKMLATSDCRSRSFLDPSFPGIDDVDEMDSDNEDECSGEEWRKFGAANSFRIPDDVDILSSELSSSSM